MSVEKDVKSLEILEEISDLSGKGFTIYDTETGDPLAFSGNVIIALDQSIKDNKEEIEDLKSRKIIAGQGLTGGGELSKDITFNIASKNDGIVINDSDIELDTVDNLSSESPTRPLSAKQGKILNDGKVNNTGADTIDGVKTFSSSPVVPDPTGDYHAAPKKYVDGLVVGLLDDRGSYDASVDAWPTTGGSGPNGTIKKGDLWYISVEGTLGGQLVEVGYSIRALVDNPEQTASNWSILNAGIGYLPENIDHKKQTITNSETDYPSGKAVFDALALKQDALAITTDTNPVNTDEVLTLRGSSWLKTTLTNLKTFLKTYFDTLYEVTANKVTSLSSSSTDTQYPSAKVVYDEITPIKVNIAKNSEEIDELQYTLQNANLNNEARATVVDYGTIALPKNAANAPVDIKLEGLSAENLVVNGDFRNGTTGWSSSFGTISVYNKELSITLTGLPSVSFGLLDGGLIRAAIVGNVYYYSCEILPKYNGSIRLAIGGGSTYGTSMIANQWNLRGIIRTASSTSSGVGILSNINEAGYQIGDIIKIRNIRAINLTAAFGAGSEPVLAVCDKIFANYFEGTKHAIGTGRFRSVLGTTVSKMYFNAGLLKSNGAVRDSIERAANGYNLIRRINASTGAVLATPVTTPLNTAGLLMSYPAGTIYQDYALADAGLYTTKMDILLTDYPISTLEEIKVIDAQGNETYLDTATAVIASNGLSFTHPSLVAGNLVFFSYYFNQERLEGKTTVSYYDSRVVRLDTANGKYYKIGFSVTNGVPSITATEV